MYNYISLEQAADILDSYRKPVNSKERLNLIKGKPLDELFPYYGATGQVGWIDSFLTDGEYILLGEDGAPFLNPYAEKAYIIHGKTWVNNHAHILHSKTNNEFLCYYLNYFNYKKYVSGTTRLKLTQAQMRKIPIPNIPSDEQSRIVARIEELFSELDKAVDTLKTTKEQMDVYRQAVLKKAFESKANASKAKLSSIGEICLGRQRSPKNISNEYPTKYIRAANITENGLKLDDILEMEFTPSERKKYYLKSGDIVVSEASGSAKQVGKPAIWKNEISKCCFQNTVIRLRLTADYSDYVFWYLKYLYLSGKIAKLVGGVGINHLGAKKFSDIEIPIIDLTAQLNMVQTIEKKMSQCDSVCKTIDTALAQADAMRQSILKQAFEEGIV